MTRLREISTVLKFSPKCTQYKTLKVILQMWTQILKEIFKIMNFIKIYYHIKYQKNHLFFNSLHHQQHYFHLIYLCLMFLKKTL